MHIVVRGCKDTQAKYDSKEGFCHKECSSSFRLNLLTCLTQHIAEMARKSPSAWQGLTIKILLPLQADTALVSAVREEQEQIQDLDKKKHKKKRKSKCQHLLDFPLLPTVQLGTTTGDYTFNVSGSFTCYASSEYESGALHTVILGEDAPLEAGEQYFYRTGDPQFGWGPEFNFTTPVPVSKHSMPYRWELWHYSLALSRAMSLFANQVMRQEPALQ